MEMQGFNVTELTNYEYVGNDYNKAVTNSSAIVIGTDWDEYYSANYRELRSLMNKDRAILYDLRSNIDSSHI
jgi:UDP-glucose 6-dehydrogenase